VSYIPFQASVWDTALPEAVGGAAVAIVVLLTEWTRLHLNRKARIAKAEFAARAELHLVRAAANLVAEGEAIPAEIQPLRYASLASLVRSGMERVGDPDYELSLGRISDETDLYNGLVLRLLLESSGVNRAMGDHPSAMSGLNQSAQQSAGRLVTALDELGTLLQTGATAADSDAKRPK
jgi:hypothetical protein